MRSLQFNILIAVGILLQSQVLAQVKKTKELSKSYEVNATDLLHVENSFGMVNIETWDKSTLDVKVTIEVEKRSDKGSQELLDRIEIKVEESTNSKSFTTQINGSVKNKNGESFRVEYDIKMPKAHSIDIEQSFGELYLDDVDGDAALAIKYGSMVTGDLNGTVTMEVSFSSAEVDRLHKGTVEVKYGSLEIDRSGKLELDQQFSEITLEEVDDLELESKYGSVEIGVAGVIDGETNFSNFNLEQLDYSIRLRSTYGDGIEIEKLSKSFTQVDMRGKYGGFEIGFEEGLKANIDVEVAFGDFRYNDLPINFSKMQKNINNANYVGTLLGGGGTIRIESEYGDVRFEEF